MTKFIAYDCLTFPEIVAMPRTTPLVIPLGEGYEGQRLANSLGDPAQVLMLPPLPYGWSGSGLSVPGGILAPLLNNLAASLREDGFSQVFLLTPQDLDLNLGVEQIRQFHPSQTSAQAFLPPDRERNKVIVLPVGHTEQHAYHLPMSTDTLIIDGISAGIGNAAVEQVFCLPVFPYGVSMHRQAFAGTLNCGGRAFEDFWIAMIDQLVGRGFNRIYMINGHGGNHSFLVNAIKYAGERHRRTFIATAWLYLSGEAGIAALNKHRESSVGGMGHACELETSLILHLRPDLVHMDRVVDEVDFISTPNYYMDWVEGGSLIANPPWDDDTRTGAYGAGSLGTAEKGRLWIAAAILEKLEHIVEINEQYARREARRDAGFGLWGKR